MRSSIRLAALAMVALAAFAALTGGAGATVLGDDVALQAAGNQSVAELSQCKPLSEYESSDAYRQCLVDNTDAEQITDYVHTPPNDLSQKQIDAVYAVSPAHDDAYGFNQTQRQHITDWMTWEKVGLKPAWYDAPSDATAESDGPDGRQATLAIETPSYVGDPATIRQDGQQVYTINGTQATIQPQNFRSEDVIGFGVVGTGGELTYDDRMGVFEYDTGGVIGTAEVYWEVEETIRTANGTETVRTRYVALVRSESNASYRHIQRGELEEQRRDAANWTEWESSLTKIYGGGVDIGQKTQVSVELNKLAHNPLSALSGQFTGLLLSLFLTLGGLLILALFGVLHLGLRYTDIAFIHRIHSLRAEEKAIDDKHRELDWREKMRSVAKWDWSDFYGDLVARAYRTIGRTPFHGMKRLLAARRPRNLVEHRLQAMGHDGYVGVVEREDVATDGGHDGDDGGDRPIISATVAHESSVGGEADTVELTDCPADFVDELDWTEQTLWNYDLRETSATPEEIRVEQAPLTLEELSDELGADLMQFDSRQRWGQYLLEFVEYVREHEFTDDEGRPDDIQFVLNQWLDTDDMLGDGFELPHFKAESEAIEWAVKHSDPVEEADRTIENIQNGVSSDD